MSPLADAAARRRRARGVLPGFGPSTGFTVLYLCVVVLVPLSTLALRASALSWADALRVVASPRALASYRLSFGASLAAAVANVLFGVLVAWVLARYRFPGRALVHAVVDLPFALSPVTVGLACVILFGPGGWFAPFFQARGIQVIFALPSMVLVTIFICLPFTIREVVPVLEEIGLDEEDASRTLGASVWHTFFRVTLPNIRWALAYGVALTTARAIGEIGAVLVVSGLLQGKTETATLFIYRAYEDRQTPEAYVVALVLAGVSVLLLLAIEFFRHREHTERTRA